MLLTPRYFNDNSFNISQGDVASIIQLKESMTP